MTEAWVKPPCGHCGILKGPEHYHKCSTRKGGLHSICKPCRVKYNAPQVKAWQAKQRERQADPNYVEAPRKAKKQKVPGLDPDYEFLTRRARLDTRSE